MNSIRKKIFLSHYGIASRYGLPLSTSIQKYWKHTPKLVKKHFEHFLFANYASSGKLKKLPSSETFIYIHYPWFNYFHWILESLPRAYGEMEELNRCTLIIPEQIYSNQFVKESLEVFHFKDILVLEDDWHAYVPNLIVPPVRPQCHKYNSSNVTGVRNLLISQFGEVGCKSQKRIYVSRKDSVRRKFINEDAVIELFAQNGFEIHKFDNYSLAEQIQLLQECSVLVSMHGAALTNVLFMNEGSTVIELSKEVTNRHDHVSIVYSELAKVLNLRYYNLQCEPADRSADFFEADMIADTRKIEKLLKEL